MKKLACIIFIFFSLIVNGEDIKQWMNLPPMKVELPAFSKQKNVDGKTFTMEQLLTFSTLNVANLSPAPGATESKAPSLQWTVSHTEQGKVQAVLPNATPALQYHAVYLANSEWMKGTLEFQLHTPTEIFIDGEKVYTHGSRSSEEPTKKQIEREWLPGKHLIIVKSLRTADTIKTLFSARFKAGKGFENTPVEFTLSPQRGKNILDVLNGKRVGKIQTSPSGKYVLLDESETLHGQTTRTTRLYHVAGKELLYTFHGKEITNITWVPGKDQIAYLVPEGKGHSLYTYDPTTRQQSCRVKVDQVLKGYSWSPDGSYLLYYTTEDHTDKAWELRKLNGMEDRQPAFRTRYFLCKYDFATGLHSRLTWGNQTTSAMSISRDGKKVLISTNEPDYQTFPYSKQSVYLLDIHTLQADTLWQGHSLGATCSFSPDGTQVLVCGGANLFGEIGINIRKGQTVNEFDTQLFIYDLASKQVQPLTKDFAPAVSQAYWHTDGNIYFIAGNTDYIHLFRYRTGTIERIDCPGDVVQRLSLPTRGHTALYAASLQSYPTCLYTLDLQTLQATRWADPQGEQYRNITFGEVKDWDYKYKKGTTIDGRYYLPADFDPNKKYPLIVYYYGGTSPVERTFGGRWPFNLYAANGYVVYVMQPSGATGFGQEFAARHQHNWGIITADEIIACTKAFLKAHPFIDSKRVGCMGASYGGFTTMLLQTRTDLFACAISHAGISSISSYWGEGYWGYSYSTQAAAHAFPWNRKDIYVDQSPLFNADKVKTPILLLHGTADVNVPTGESIQFYTALKLLGKDAELVLIKNADHAVVAYPQRILWNNTILAYFAKYLKGQPAWWEHSYKEKNL